jgi:hypothetical protein
MSITLVWKSVAVRKSKRMSLILPPRCHGSLVYSAEEWTEPLFGLIMCWDKENATSTWVADWTRQQGQRRGLDWEVWLAEAILERPDHITTIKFIPVNLEQWWQAYDPYLPPSTNSYQCTRPFNTLGARQLRLVKRVAGGEP